jgi:hypothetical protein
MLEQRYLWVDSVCIISDDAEDKTTQIPQMASIYGQALLTIVAAAGEDANHGLSGLNVRRTVRDVVDVGTCHIVQSHEAARPGHEGNPIWSSKWATRAWTLQEMLLSPRSLIFLESQVVWHCKEAKWFEGFDFDHPKMEFRW